jgi:hypothetical protein
VALSSSFSVTLPVALPQVSAFAASALPLHTWTTLFKLSACGSQSPSVPSNCRLLTCSQMTLPYSTDVAVELAVLVPVVDADDVTDDVAEPDAVLDWVDVCGTDVSVLDAVELAVVKSQAR